MEIQVGAPGELTAHRKLHQPLSLWLMCGNTWSPCSWLYGVLLIVVHFYMSLVFRGPHVAGEMTATIESWHKIPIASTVVGAIAVVLRSQTITSLSQDLSKPLKFILILNKLQFKCWGCHMLKWAFCYRLFFLPTFKCTVATLHHYSVSMCKHLLDSFLDAGLLMRDIGSLAQFTGSLNKNDVDRVVFN